MYSAFSLVHFRLTRGASRRHQDGHREAQDRPEHSKVFRGKAGRGSLPGPIGPREGGPKMDKCRKIMGKARFLVFSPCRFRLALEASRQLQDVSN
eukprot:7425215-Pyramimonas_sp.AAC.1